MTEPSASTGTGSAQAPVVRPGPGRRAAVLGHPVAHSLSPVLHRAAYAALGLSGWTYQAVDVDEHGLAGFLAGLDQDWAGLSITMPLKQVVRQYLSDESALARDVGVVNTVVLDAQGRHGYNTDVYGIIHALAELGVTRLAHAMIVGGGATAASALAAVRDLGCTEPVVAVRSTTRAARVEEAAERLGVHPRLVALDDAAALAGSGRRLRETGGAVVATLPAGAADPLAGALVDAVLGGAGPRPALLDVVYAPWPTPLATAWRAAGGLAAGGFSMLVHQAEGQVRLMTGRRPPLAVMRAAGQAHLDART